MTNDENRKNVQPKNKKSVEAVKNQLNEKYQSSVIEDKLQNNKGIYTYNNRSN